MSRLRRLPTVRVRLLSCDGSSHALARGHRNAADARAPIPPGMQEEEGFSVHVSATRDGRYLTITAMSKTSTEVHTMPAADPAAAPSLVLRRTPGALPTPLPPPTSPDPRSPRPPPPGHSPVALAPHDALSKE